MKKLNTYNMARSASKWLLTVAIATPLLAPGTVFAQDDDSEVLEEVIAVGIRGSLDSAAQVKRYSDTIVDAITAEDIGVFSDNNIGEALSRVPGVALERSEGEGYRISVRGLGPRFVRTTLNGRTALSSPGGENGRDSRGFSFNIIPSEVINKAQVYKSFRAIDTEGGIGGTVDLLTVRPLDFAAQKKDDLYVSGALRSTYNTLSENNTPRGSIFANYKVNDQFAFFLSGVIDNADRVQNSTESQDLDVERFDLAAGTLVNGVALTEETRFNAALFDGVRNYNRNRQRDRLTFTGGFQWQPSDNLDVNFDWTHGTLDETRNDYRSWLRVEDVVDRQADTVTSMVIDFADASNFSDGTILAFDFEGFSGRKGLDVAHLTQTIDETIDVGGINLEWTNDSWTVTGDLGFAGQEKVTDQRRVTVGENRNSGRFDDGFNGSFDIRSGYPIITLTDTLGVAYDPTSTEDINYLEDRISLYLEDNQEVSFRLDFAKEFDAGGNYALNIDRIKFGFSYRDTDRTREEFRTNGSNRDRDENGDRIWENIPIAPIGTIAVTEFFDDVGIPGFYNSYMVPDFYAWSAADPRGTFSGNPYDGAARINREYDVSEDVGAVYLQLDFSNDNVRFPFRGNIGVRYVDTQQTSVGILGDQIGSDVIIYDPHHVIERDYDNWLPSFNLAVDLTDEWVLRFAASKALSRPDPIDLQVGLDLDIDDLDGSSGNPDLEPYGTDNFDVILEWYPEFGGSYAIGAFRKNLDGWITGGEETVSIDLGPDLGGFEDFDIDRPVNTDGGTITGFEIAFHIPFDVFSESLSGFGIQGSYTVIDAKMDSISDNTDEPIALPGTSDNSANLVAYFEKGPFGARVAYTYREDFLHQEGAEGFLEFTEGTEVIDMNLDWKFNDQWRLRFSAYNVTDEQRRRYFVKKHLMSDIRNDGRSYVVELRANF